MTLPKLADLLATGSLFPSLTSPVSIASKSRDFGRGLSFLCVSDTNDFILSAVSPILRRKLDLLDDLVDDLPLLLTALISSLRSPAELRINVN